MSETLMCKVCGDLTDECRCGAQDRWPAVVAPPDSDRAAETLTERLLAALMEYDEALYSHAHMIANKVRFTRADGWELIEGLREKHNVHELRAAVVGSERRAGSEEDRELNDVLDDSTTALKMANARMEFLERIVNTSFVRPVMVKTEHGTYGIELRIWLQRSPGADTSKWPERFTVRDVIDDALCADSETGGTTHGQ